MLAKNNYKKTLFFRVNGLTSTKLNHLYKYVLTIVLIIDLSSHQRVPLCSLLTPAAVLLSVLLDKNCPKKRRKILLTLALSDRLHLSHVVQIRKTVPL